MKQKLLIAVALLLVFQTTMAQLYIFRESKITFFSEAPLENIEAENKTASSRINSVNNDIAVKVPVKGFTFEKKLMQEHFNENYMESEKFPYATFAGKIQEQIDYSKDGTSQVSAIGTMKIHGVEKEVTLKGTLTVKGKNLVLHAEFTVRLEDYNIKIPNLVVQNIAEEVLVKVDIDYIPYEKK
ncbi:MAG: YceI family protein [Flavobacteriales bacterium]|nr:YceI family protein [Flavobacteriales bacterium]